jgi:hypothetical protein
MLQKYILGYFLINATVWGTWPYSLQRIFFFLIIFDNTPKNSQSARQNWRINSQKCAVACLRPPWVTEWWKNGNYGVHKSWELILQNLGVV